MKQTINCKAHRKIQDGILYAFQYGLITEKKHFQLLDKLNDMEYESNCECK